MGYIIGKDRKQINLLPKCIEDYVEKNNSVRVIDAYINSLNLDGMGFTHGQPNENGRPPYSPYDILKLYIFDSPEALKRIFRQFVKLCVGLELVAIDGSKLT